MLPISTLAIFQYFDCMLAYGILLLLIHLPDRTDNAAAAESFKCCGHSSARVKPGVPDRPTIFAAQGLPGFSWFFLINNATNHGARCAIRRTINREMAGWSYGVRLLSASF